MIAAAAGAPAYRQEIQTQRATSTLLLSRARGPAGSCINNNLRYVDDSYCSVATDATLRALQRDPNYADFGRALARLINADRSMYACGPIRGPGGYSGQLAALASAPNSTPPFGKEVVLANRIGSCVHQGDVPRLFVLDDLDPGAALHNTADLKACLDAPAYCRVPRGQMNPLSCDARGLADLIDETLIRIPTPYRCRLELPLSRIDLQPDGYRVVLANGFRCRSSGDCRPCPPDRPCNVDALGNSELKYLVWDQLTSVLGGDLGVPGDLDAPSCYPERDELGHPARPLTGTSALLGQLKNGQTLVNPAGCGWQ